MKWLFALVVNVITMRRLHQTILLATSVIFFILFILYKHEYDRLSNLLHVLNTFGQSSCDGSSTNAKGELFLSSNSQSHVWQKVGPVFTYSAVWDLNVVKIFAVLPLSFSLKDVPFAKCLLRHSKREKDVNQQSFSESEMSLETELLDGSELHWRVIYFVCKRVSTAEGVPVSVALLYKNNINYKTGDSMPFIPVLRLNTLESRTELSNRSIAICAAVSHQQPMETSIINQFIQFHSYIGVNRITFYDFAGSTSQQSSNLIKSNTDAKSESNTRIQILNWNYPVEFPTANLKNPSTDSVSNMMRRDCAFRHFDHHFVLVLDLNQLIVPRFHSHLSRFLQDEEEQDDSIGVAQFTLKTFCSEFKANAYVNLATDWPAFLKSHWMQATSEEEKERALILNPRAIRGFDKNGVPVLKVGYHRLQVDSEIAAFHQYKECGGNTSYAHFDNIVPRKFGTHFVPILPNMNLNDMGN